MRTENLGLSGGWRRSLQLGLGCALVLLFSGCRQDMHDQSKYEPLEASSFFDDGTSARAFPANTVARGQLREDRPFYTGFEADGSWVEELPLELTPALLERGRDRYAIYCTPCHDYIGSGRGIVVQRGFKQPTSYHDERLRNMPIGYFYDVITNGFATMSSYAAQVKPEDRWAIAAWVRVLQRSQSTSVDELPAEERRQLERAGSEPREEAHAAGGGAGGRP